MRIFDLLTVTPANRTLSIYDKDNKFVENVGIKEMRKYMSYYLKNMPNATQMRQKINQIETKQELQDCIITYFKNI